MKLPAEWRAEIEKQADAGLDPDAIANYFGRMVDEITLEEITAVRDAAIARQRGGPPDSRTSHTG
ncbi:hypothetical protein [Nocardia pseudovaccinii]|uniref:hypothetical protein n=1 Tax=Nocardia pseudovaccinii TaxID=189540 RepID=UPI0007A3A89C|nr:hypothetical protein [Nocardia pseudovaccinii]